MLRTTKSRFFRVVWKLGPKVCSKRTNGLSRKTLLQLRMLRSSRTDARPKTWIPSQHLKTLRYRRILSYDAFWRQRLTLHFIAVWVQWRKFLRSNGVIIWRKLFVLLKVRSDHFEGPYLKNEAADLNKICMEYFWYIGIVNEWTKSRIALNMHKIWAKNFGTGLMDNPVQYKYNIYMYMSFFAISS
jgi:hypothetical protein